MSRVRRRFAQHFLEASWADRLVTLVGARAEDVLLEVGPGRGVLTFPLAKAAARVVAVEIDRDLASSLEAASIPNLTVVAADFLVCDIAALPVELSGARVVGNLPYSVGSQIVMKLLELSGDGRYFRDATIMLQREVANRMTSRPGSRDWGPLSIATALHADASCVLTLPPGAFRPMPKVTSAVVRLRFRPPTVRIRSQPLFNSMVRAMFTQRRKTALNALRPFVSGKSSVEAEEVFEVSGVNPRKRPGELELSELADLSEVLRSEAL